MLRNGSVLHVDCTSHVILAFLAKRPLGAARAFEIREVNSWAFGARNNTGPMGTLQANGFVEKIDRGVYGITQAGRDELRRLG